LTSADVLTVPAARGIEHLLDAAPWARDALRPHAGKTARLVAGPFDLALFVTASGGVAAADPADAATPTLSVTVPLAAVPKLLTGDPAARSAAHVEGDAGFAQTVWTLVAGLRWDAEGDLGRVIGGAAAHRVGGAVRALGAEAQDLAQRAGDAFAGWLSEEARVVVPTAEQRAWQDDVDALRDAVDRLDVRLRGLETAGDTRGTRS
jgi:ubiquinone biosynthesis accessory factor UbiJ